jgi:hypothetical protein
MQMLGEASPWSLAGAAAAMALLWLAAWTLEWAWWTPRRLRRALEAQGLRGTRYRLFTGDVPENARLNREARSKPLPLGSHEIIPRVQPMFSNAIKENGEKFSNLAFLLIFCDVRTGSVGILRPYHLIRLTNRELRVCIRLEKPGLQTYSSENFKRSELFSQGYTLNF